MSAALRRLGFEVTTELDADRVALSEALRTFTRRSLGADVALVFYAGHGIEMDRANYLVPVDARLERDVDVRFETVTLDDMLASTLGASLRVVILDACRNNPLARSMQRTLASRSVSGGSFADLNEDLLGDETLVAYAAAAGTTAADGRGRNSPYTAALLAHLEQPLEIGLLFRRVRAQVLASTNGQQRPHEYQSLVGEHYLSVPPTAEAVTVAAAAPAVLPAVDAVPPAAADVVVGDLNVARLRQLAEQGDARAQTELGERYEDGRGGVAQDYGSRCRGSAERPTRALLTRRRPLVSCTCAVAGWRRTTRLACSGPAVPPSRDTPAGRATSVSCTATAAGWRRTTRKPSAGTAEPLSRDTPPGKPTSATCTRTASGCGATTSKPSGGSAEPPSRDTPRAVPASA